MRSADGERQRKKRYLNASVLVLCASVLLLPLTGQAQDWTPAQIDSAVTYIEALEYDLAICGITATATQDTLRNKISMLNYKLEISESARGRWYQDPRLWFLIGATAATLVVGSTLQITF